MTATATTTAAIITPICSAMPIAVMIELTEKTMSMSDDLRDDRAEAGAGLRRGRALRPPPSTSWWISLRRLDDQEEAAGEQHQVAPGEGVTAELNTGWVRWISQNSEKSSDDAEDERQRQADLAGALGLLRRQACRRSPR